MLGAYRTSGRPPGVSPCRHGQTTRCGFSVNITSRSRLKTSRRCCGRSRRAPRRHL